MRLADQNPREPPAVTRLKTGSASSWEAMPHCRMNLPSANAASVPTCSASKSGFKAAKEKGNRLVDRPTPPVAGRWLQRSGSTGLPCCGGRLRRASPSPLTRPFWPARPGCGHRLDSRSRGLDWLSETHRRALRQRSADRAAQQAALRVKSRSGITGLHALTR